MSLVLHSPKPSLFNPTWLFGLLLIVASLAWYFASDRLTPYTSQARVQALLDEPSP